MFARLCMQQAARRIGRWKILQSRFSLFWYCSGRKIPIGAGFTCVHIEPTLKSGRIVAQNALLAEKMALCCEWHGVVSVPLAELNFQVAPIVHVKCIRNMGVLVVGKVEDMYCADRSHCC